MKSHRYELFVCGVLVLFLFILDIISKQWIASHLVYHEEWPITSFFSLVFTINKGVSFSMLSANHLYGVYALIGFTGLLSCVVLYFVITSQSLIERVGFSMVFAGAIGNLFDRIRIGGVVDFLYFHMGEYYWPAFNVADSAISLGVALLFIYYFVLQKKKEEQV